MKVAQLVVSSWMYCHAVRFVAGSDVAKAASVKATGCMIHTHTSHAS